MLIYLHVFWFFAIPVGTLLAGVGMHVNNRVSSTGGAKGRFRFQTRAYHIENFDVATEVVELRKFR